MKLLTPAEVSVKLGITKSSLRGLRHREKSFPQPIRMSPRIVRWDEEDINKWLETRKEKASG